ncbi:MAG TPA: proton-conducting transporter membrane subunit [Candidatus Limnocylindrales bacterium]
MSVLPFLGLAFGGAAASLLLRRRVAASAIVGLLALVAATIAAAAIRPDDALAIAGSGLTGSAFGRLFLVLVTGSATVLVGIALATGWTRNLPGALLAGLGGIGLALSLPDPTMAALATLIGGLAGVLITLPGTVTPRAVAVAAREVRAIAVGGALVLLAMAWISRPLGSLAEDTAVFGLAYLAVAVGMAMRFGAIPFHLWAARVADAAPEVALPLLIAWGPAALAVVGLAWIDGSIAPVAPLTGQLPIEHLVIVLIGLACLVLGAIAAWVQEDLEHVAGYATVQDAGVVILAFAVLDPAVWEPSRTWILVLLAVRTAFAAWAVAIRARFGSRRIRELRGWARRSPMLLVALIAIGATSVGWPGLLAFDARASVITLAFDGPVRGLVLVAVFLPLLYYGRLLAIGFARPTPEVAAVADDRPRALARAAGGSAASTSGLETLGRLVAVNRGPLVASLVLVLAASAVTIAGGGFGFVGVTAAAVEAAPVVTGGNDLPGSGPGPSGQSPAPADQGGPSPAPNGPSGSPGSSGDSSAPPSPSRSPSPSVARPSPSHSPSPSVSPGASGSPQPTKSPTPSRSPRPSGSFAA